MFVFRYRPWLVEKCGRKRTLLLVSTAPHLRVGQLIPGESTTNNGLRKFVCVCVCSFREEAESLHALEDFLEDSPHPAGRTSQQPHSVHEEPNRYVGFGNTPQRLESDSSSAWSSLQSVSAGWPAANGGLI